MNALRPDQNFCRSEFPTFWRVIGVKISKIGAITVNCNFSFSITLSCVRGRVSSLLPLPWAVVLVDHHCFMTLKFAFIIIFSFVLQVMRKRGVKDVIFSCPVGTDYEGLLKDVARAEKGWNIISLRYFDPVGAHTSGRFVSVLCSLCSEQKYVCSNCCFMLRWKESSSVCLKRKYLCLSLANEGHFFFNIFDPVDLTITDYGCEY